MKKLLGTLGLAALLAPSAAFAGVGATIAQGNYFGHPGAGSYPGAAPTIDYRAKGLLVQVHALELVGSIANQDADNVNLYSPDLATGVGVSTVVTKKKVAPEVEGVVMPGGHIFFAQDKVGSESYSGFNFDVEARMGMEMKKGAGFGVYVVPMIGVGKLPGDNQDMKVHTGGTLQVSFWLTDKGSN